MNRRATLATLLGRGREKPQAPLLPIVNSGLEPYSGPWAYEQAAHLLRRSMFAPTYTQIKAAAGQGLEATLELLFSELPQPEPPLNYYY